MRDGITYNAVGSIFGWDFQINAAILLFLREPDKIIKLRVEGVKQDIEIYKENQIDYAQCKSVLKAGDYSNVSKNYKSALESLNRAIATTPNCESLIFVTNTDKPFGCDRNTFFGYTWIEYKELPPESAKKIQTTIKNNNFTQIDTAKLKVCVIPFISNDFQTRYRCINERVNSFLNQIDIDVACSEELMMVWQQMLLHNASEKPLNLTIEKGEFLWPLIVLLIDRVTYDWLGNDYDESVLDELEQKYSRLITFCENKIQLCFDIVHDFEVYQYTGRPGDKIKSFAREYSEKYKKIIAESIADSEEKEALTKMILYKILTKRKIINDIHANLNLK